MVKGGTLWVQATNWPSSFEGTTDGTGVVGHAGAALLRELADRLGLTRALGWGETGGRRGHQDAAVLRELAVLLADGGACLSDLAALGDQPALFGPGPPRRPPGAWLTVLLGTLTGWPGCGLPGRTPAPAPGPPTAPRRSSC